MRIHYFASLSALLCCFILTSCDPNPTPVPDNPDCGYELPLVDLSDGECDPNFLNFERLDLQELASEPPLPAKCKIVGGYSRKFQIATPPAGSSSLALHLYNGTRGRAQIQVFGTARCGSSANPLTNCVDMSAAVSILRINNIDGYKQIYALISYTNSNGNDPEIEDGDFLSVAAYSREPEIRSVKYGGIDPENTIRTINQSCDGASWERIILASCDPNADLENWEGEFGMKKSEGYTGRGGALQAYALPPRSNPHKAKDAVDRKILDANGDGTSSFVDVVVAHDPLYEFDDVDLRQPKEALTCRSFMTGGQSNAKRKDNIVIANIDSGIELGNPGRTHYWNGHKNLSVSGPFTNPGDYGYDFFYADETPEDLTGHGTATAGTMVGSYRAAEPLTIIHYKVFGEDGESTYFGALVALHVAIDNGVDIINASWGKVDDELPVEMECAIAYAQKEGVQIFTSAGNDQVNIDFPGYGPTGSTGSFAGRTVQPQWPASFATNYAAVTTVAAYQFPGMTTADKPILEANFSNSGGHAVSVAGFLTAETFRYHTSDFYFPFGTSISSPLVATRYATIKAQGGSMVDFQNTWQHSGHLNGAVQGGLFLEVCD